MGQLNMQPPPGERLLRFVGDRLSFRLSPSQSGGFPPGWRAFLRTNLGRAKLVRQEIVHAHFHHLPLAGASWRDLPLLPQPDGSWAIDLPLTEVGFFKAKAYATDEHGYQHWPDGADFGVTVHPDHYRTANTIYCAFVRMFGPSKPAVATVNAKLDAQLQQLDQQGYTVIPPSGKLRDLRRELPHIIGTLGCRIVHLLPVNPTPTTFARCGRFGSPYAIQDLTAIDPALVEFDKRTTGVEQFCELAHDIHARGARLFLDVVINHTGWGSTLYENHPEWFLREKNGEFASPGAWGNIWADLVELEHKHPELWEHVAEAFLIWCRRGVDGFRCDAGYKVPARAWQYIIARVRQEFPEALFLLEGLGGGWWDTDALLTEGGMQWAYSELFQEFSGTQVQGYLDHALKQSARVGVLVHYSETHDNQRLASCASGSGAPPVGQASSLSSDVSSPAPNSAWSLHRNRLCALTSVIGGYGFTGGVEWLATERVNVHSSRGMAWGRKENIVPELAKLNQLLATHPCFFDGAKLTRLSANGSPVFALRRDSDEGVDSVLVLANTDPEKPHIITLEKAALPTAGAPVSDPAHKTAGRRTKADLEIGAPWHELLEQPLPVIEQHGSQFLITVPPLACYCLSTSPKPLGLAGDAYRTARAQAAWAMQALSQCLPMEAIGHAPFQSLAKLVSEDPAKFLAACSRLDAEKARTDLLGALRAEMDSGRYPPVVRWTPADAKRVTMVPPGHWLLIEDATSFSATLHLPGEKLPLHAKSLSTGYGCVACFQAGAAGDAELLLERFATKAEPVKAAIRFLTAEPRSILSAADRQRGLNAPVALLTNGIGGMARLGVDLGSIKSKYDCLLAANLHPSVPVDRHVFAKRVRVWCNAGGFITPLNAENLSDYSNEGRVACWSFQANAGDGKTVRLEVFAAMVPGKNTTVLRFRRYGGDEAAPLDVRLTVRVDIEDRNFHSETKRNGGSEHHFHSHTRALMDRPGFEFTPAHDRQLHVFASGGAYHPGGEWSVNIPHPVEQSRGQEGAGDAFSPGWFEIPLRKGEEVTLVVTAELDWQSQGASAQTGDDAGPTVFIGKDAFADALRQAAKAFVVRRDSGKTVIAGYPWFLDWGRDTLIAARGLLAAGLADEVRQILVTFARFEEHGTLPNIIHGENTSNRDTVDAALWFGVVCEDIGGDIYEERAGKRTIAEVLRSIAVNYLKGTPNGIRVDAASGLVWSPSHFTWMDTNYPAGTPREGYAVEIQAQWIRLLRQLARIGAEPVGESWEALAAKAEKSFQNFFWLEEGGYFADALLGGKDVPARNAIPDHALRSNMLFAVTLGLASGERAQRCVQAAARHLIVPGAIRSLAPLPVSPPLPIRSASGQLLNDPIHPYCGRYEGDEDTRRKPAYHNGTAWVWPFPSFCEALALAWDCAPEAVNAAKAYLGSTDKLLAEGCVGQLPEIVDGDAPHQQRGCDAQAWSVTETLRVWEWLKTVEG